MKLPVIIHKAPNGKIQSIEYSPGGSEVALTELHAISPDQLPWEGVTDFQRRVYRELMTVPAGTTVSYQELAARVGNPNGARAIGHAVARNPFLFVVPCHRVIKSDGGLGGFACGLEVKKRLLAFEAGRGAF